MSLRVYESVFGWKYFSDTHTHNRTRHVLCSSWISWELCTTQFTFNFDNAWIWYSYLLCCRFCHCCCCCCFFFLRLCFHVWHNFFAVFYVTLSPPLTIAVVVLVYATATTITTTTVVTSFPSVFIVLLLRAFVLSSLVMNDDRSKECLFIEKNRIKQKYDERFRMNQVAENKYRTMAAMNSKFCTLHTHTLRCYDVHRNRI